MNLTAIVPVWNGRDLLARLLDSLEVQTLPVSELLVVDNGSTDGAPELARARGARVIPMGRNAGFAAAVNRGIRESRGAWIAVLNNDVRLAPDYLATLAAAGAAFATGKIFAADGSSSLDATFDAVCRGGLAWRVGHARADGPSFAKPCPIASPPWTAVLFRAEVFQRIGLLREEFESYLEDVEFGLRCAARGVTGLYVPEAIAWHQGSATLGRWHPDTVRRLARNQCYLIALHYPISQWWPILLAHLLWGAVATRHGHGMAWLHGKWQGLRQASRLRAGAELVSPDFLRQSERTIYHIQRATGFDKFWRLYFVLTGGGAK